MRPIDPSMVVRGQYDGYLDEPGVQPDSETETFVALRCEIDNWRWAGVPFYLRTGKRMAEGARIISIAFHQPPKSMFPPGSGVGAHGPDHLTFDLADASKLSLSFYGKRPGPGMKLDKQSLEFALHGNQRSTTVLEAYERLIYDAMCNDHTLFSTARGNREPVGEVDTVARLATPAAAVPARLLGPERDAPADRTPHVAPAIRADLAQLVAIVNGDTARSSGIRGHPISTASWAEALGCPYHCEQVVTASKYATSRSGEVSSSRRGRARSRRSTRACCGPSRRAPRPCR